ncbi:MAG TPA: triple tyrosine motif-containing protein [Rhizomicrobium sp.]|nr:triple tyrosine motif-containing protein [Rhizomicrobium sp.]
MVRLFAAALLLLFDLTGLASASDSTPLSEMDHAMWTARDGAPQGIEELARGRDGILWIGTEGGLFTFDGHAFNAFQSEPGQPDIPGGEVTSIFESRDGAMWVAFYEGPIARIAHRRITLFTQADHDMLCCLHSISQARDGSMWAVSGQQSLVRFGRDGKWHMVPNPAGVSGGRIFGIFIDSLDTLWVPQGSRLYRRPLSQSAWYPTEAGVEAAFGFVESPDHSVWITDLVLDTNQGRTQHIDRFGKVLDRVGDSDQTTAILSVADGSIVTATSNHGLRRYAPDFFGPTHSGAKSGPENYTHLDGLSSDSTTALLLDDDGNIWAGGQRGLDRFRTARLARFVTKSRAEQWLVCTDRRNNLWIAADTNQLYEVSGSGTKSYPNTSDTYSISCGNDGITRLIDERGIWQVDAGGIHGFPSMPGAHARAIMQVVATPQHRLFASVAHGLADGWLWQYNDNHWTELPGAPQHTPFVLYLDSRDRLWAGYRKGLVGQNLDGAGRLLSSGNPGLGSIYALQETSHGMFAGGVNGLAVRRGDRFDMLTFADRPSSLGIAGMVESRDGDLWLNASHGVVRIHAGDLLASLRNSHLPLKSARITEGEFVGPVRLAAGTPTAARDARGNLWFATINGLFHLDPAHLQSPSLGPILSIKSIAADGTLLDSGGTIGPQPQILDIQYLGVNLTAPEDVVYRYRLDGLDTQWQDAGHRTEAIYTHLRPGTYTFRVMASNDDRTWTAPISTASMTVLPSFYQTNWFYFACGAVALLLLWFIVNMRIRAISRTVRARAEERADERIRIARELHDTLLQGFQGLLLTFHVTAQKVAADDASRAMLERTLSMADRIIVEGRNRVSSLRSEQINDGELLGSLESAGRDIGMSQDVEYLVRRSGTAAQLSPHVAEEVFYIAREALTNAFRHAEASQICLDLHYDSRTFSMVCKDNGRGFDPATGMKAGHWGLKGMIERAQRLGGKLECRSAPLQGTVVLFTLISRRAYKDQSRVAFLLRGLQRTKQIKSR